MEQNQHLCRIPSSSGRGAWLPVSNKGSLTLLVCAASLAPTVGRSAIFFCRFSLLARVRSSSFWVVYQSHITIHFSVLTVTVQNQNIWSFSVTSMYQKGQYQKHIMMTTLRQMCLSDVDNWPSVNALLWKYLKLDFLSGYPLLLLKTGKTCFLHHHLFGFSVFPLSLTAVTPELHTSIWPLQYIHLLFSGS